MNNFIRLNQTESKICFFDVVCLYKKTSTLVVLFLIEVMFYVQRVVILYASLDQKCQAKAD